MRKEEPDDPLTPHPTRTPALQFQFALMALLDVAVALEDPFDEAALDGLSCLELVDAVATVAGGEGGAQRAPLRALLPTPRPPLTPLLCASHSSRARGLRARGWRGCQAGAAWTWPLPTTCPHPGR